MLEEVSGYLSLALRTQLSRRICMTIADKLQYLSETKSLIKEAIRNKGVNVEDTDPFRVYADKIGMIQGGGEGGGDASSTVWAYYTGDVIEDKKVILVKSNASLPSGVAFCNGFRPYIIMDGYAYGTVGDATDSDFNVRRQIVNGIISDEDSVSVQTYGSLSKQANIVSLYLLNGTCSVETVLNAGAGSIVRQVPFVGTKKLELLPSNNNFVCETGVAEGTNGYGRFFDAIGGTVLSGFVPSLGTSCFCFEDKDQNFYWVGQYTNTQRWSRATNTTETIAGRPTFNMQATLPSGYRLFIQTKDFKYLLTSVAYVDLDIENNTFTVKEYPESIKQAIGINTVHSMQVFYDGFFSIQLSDGRTLMCKYENTMDDVEVKEIVDPIVIDGDPTIYQRQYSPDRTYWFNRPVVISGNVVAIPIAKGPAGLYKAEEPSTPYVAYTPTKERFNNTVLTGFLNGTSKDEEGRQLVEVTTVLPPEDRT